MKVWAKNGGILLLLVLCINCNQDVERETAEVVDSADQFFTRDGDYAASHILIAFAGAEGADDTITASEQEAQEEAKNILGKVLAQPELFEALAREHSDGTSASVGGNLGSWEKGDFIPEFERAVDGLAFGQILDEPLRSNYGYHVIRRNPLKVMHYGASGFFISFKGHPRNPPTVHRSREEAEALAQSLVEKVTAANFDEMAKEYNDLGDGPQFMGIMLEGDQLPAGTLDTLKGLPYGGVGGPVAFPMGYAFMRREKVVRYNAAGILIAFKGAEGARRVVSRSQEEAQELALKVLSQLQENPDSFAELAREHSDSPTAVKGGEMGLFFGGEVDPDFRKALEALKDNETTSEPVATRFGFHIIKRLPEP